MPISIIDVTLLKPPFDLFDSTDPGNDFNTDFFEDFTQENPNAALPSTTLGRPPSNLCIPQNKYYEADRKPHV